MTIGTLLFVHLIPRIPRGELKSIFFFTNIFWTHETDFANCLYSNTSPEFNFFPNVVVSTGIMYPLNKKGYDIIHPWLRLTCSAKFYHS